MQKIDPWIGVIQIQQLFPMPVYKVQKGWVIYT